MLTNRNSFCAYSLYPAIIQSKQVIKNQQLTRTILKATTYVLFNIFPSRTKSLSGRPADRPQICSANICFGKSEILQLSKLLSLKITLWKLKIFWGGYAWFVILNFWSTFRFLLIHCTGALVLIKTQKFVQIIWEVFQIFSCYFGEEENHSESLKPNLLSPQHLRSKLSTATLHAVNISEGLSSESSWNSARTQWIISFVWFCRIRWFCLFRIVLFVWCSWSVGLCRSELNTLTDSAARSKVENLVTKLSYTWEMLPWWLAVRYRRCGEDYCLLLRTPKRVRVFVLQSQLNCRNMQERQVICKVSTKCPSKETETSVPANGKHLKSITTRSSPCA